MRADFFPDADPILQGRVAIIEVTAKDTRDPLQEHGRRRHEALRRELPHGLVCVGAHLFDPAPTQEGPQDGGPRLGRRITGPRRITVLPAINHVRPPLGIYGSTRTYRPVFEMHGWGEVTSELHALLERGDTDAMTSLITAEMLDTFSVSATWGHLAAALAATAAWWIVSRPTAPTCGRPKPACCGTRSPPTCAISPDDDKRAGFLGRCGNPP